MLCIHHLYCVIYLYWESAVSVSELVPIPSCDFVQQIFSNQTWPQPSNPLNKTLSQTLLIGMSIQFLRVRGKAR